MKYRPVNLRAHDVRATIDGTKIQLRVLVRPQPEPIPDDVWKDRRLPSEKQYWWPCRKAKSMVSIIDMGGMGPLGSVGDRLWVKETWAPGERAMNEPRGAVYRATDPDWETTPDWKWTPSIHMPRWASRLDLEIKAVRVERLQTIDKAGSISEGIERIKVGPHEAWKNYQFKTAHPKRGEVITDKEHRVIGLESPCASFASLVERSLHRSQG